MALIAMPSKVYFESVDSLKLQRGGLAMRSRYTGKRQVVSFPFALWVFDGTVIPVEGLEAGEWRAFLTGLQGDANTFQLAIPGLDGGPLSGWVGANPTVGSGGAAVGATSMPLAGTASKLLLKKGDYFTVNDELKVAQADVTTSGGGTATLTFEPLLRQAVTPGMVIHVTDPYVVLAAADKEQAGWALGHPVVHKIRLKAVEAF